MDTDRILCKIFKVHNYIDILNHKKYLIRKCSCCDKYKVTHKDYLIESRYNFNELPKKIKQLVS